MNSLALLLEYEGTNYVGWQNQPNGQSVQQMIENAIVDTFGVDQQIVGSGRTDSGVHARGQVAHVHLPEGSHRIPMDKVHVALNTHLPRDIRVRAACGVTEEFHARFDAVSREYIYVITKQASVFSRTFAWTPELPFDAARFAEATHVFEGLHDFTAISKHNPSTGSYMCNVESCRVEEHADRFLVRIRADRFVYGMCRAIIGTAMTVARGKIEYSDAETLLASGVRSGQAPLAPPQGLVLNHVRYRNGIFDDENYF
ncbi:MAG: tRNA pseudouridine(38-40) synthase TruA [Ignavibacteria bacterium]|nr:tRNA pseudouridine(38-40) synthase TruA [Ignavibacteria bacterium]MBK6761259.1 tRNA pseudouridine(38-40) synthase TruA [Ignavibacteria bacterium]